MKEKLLSELSSWLGNISEDSPCGNNLEYDYQEFKAKVDTTTESSEWKKLEKEAHSFIEKTKDIRLYVAYSKILIHTEKNPLKGVAKGLTLISQCIKQHWDCLYPEVDKDDPEDAHIDRINALANMGEYKYLVLPLRNKVSILSIDLGSYTLSDLIALKQGDVVEGKQSLDGLMPDEEKTYDELIQWFMLSLELANDIKTTFVEKSGEPFSDFDKYLLPMLQEGCELKGDTVEGEGGDSAPVADSAVNSTQAVTQQLSGAINNRNDITKAIDLICEYYDNNEPSSPIPLMLKRARKMVSMDYREIYAEFSLGRDDDLDKVFGNSNEEN